MSSFDSDDQVTEERRPNLWDYGLAHSVVGCVCVGAEMKERVIERPGVHLVVLHCLACGDARVIRKIP